MVGGYLCSTVVSHTLLPKGSMQEDKKQYNDKTGTGTGIKQSIKNITIAPE